MELKQRKLFNTNKLLSFVFAFFVSANLFGQIDSTKVAFVSYWSIGDSYDFKITKIDKRWEEDKLIKDAKQEYFANFTVIDSTETSYTINWSYINDLENNYGIPKELLERLKKYQSIDVRYKTSEVGDFIEVLNWEEIGKLMNNLFDEVIDAIGVNDKEKKDSLSLALQPLKQIYSSKEGVELLVLKEIQYFHFLMGIEYDITEPIIYDDELPNLLGGKPIKAKAKLYFENVDFEENFCVVKQEMNLDPKSTKSLLNNLYKQLNINDKEFSEVLKTTVLEINDNNTFEFYYNPCIPHKIETNRESIVDINNEKIKRIDKIIIELIYDE